MSHFVDPKVYTRDYYLSDCTGYEEFLRSKGMELDPRLKKITPRLTLKKHQKLLDIGCGRGEIVFYAARQEISSVGIDYSDSAVDLANEARQNQETEIKRKSKFLVMNAKKLTFEDNYFDWVVMTDVVEHLYPDELEEVYGEVFRVLKPSGTLLIHTEPNRIYNELTYPLYCFPMSKILIWINKQVSGKTYPGLPHPSLLRTETHKQMHINEATYLGLYKQLKRVGFEIRIDTLVTILKPKISWKDTIFNAMVCWHPWSRFWPVNILFANDFVVTARKN